MRFGIVSDIHLGDPMCSLIKRANDTYVPGEKYEIFRQHLGTENDYLIVAGDIIDLSISDYQTAFAAGREFFKQIQRDKIAKNVIYVAGNHDFDIWHTVEYQINIIHQINQGKPARGFKWSVPGLIDDRPDSQARGFQLPGTTDVVDPDKFTGVPLFINSITTDDGGKGTPTHFYFAYPNLYIVTDTESVIVTHGHYLEAYWTLTCEWAEKVAEKDLGIDEKLDLWEMVAINFPTCQLACSGVGQAGPLTKLVQQIQREVKDKNLKRTDKYLKNLDNAIDKLTPYFVLDPREVATDALSKYLRKKALKALGKMEDTRFSKKFIDKPEVQERFRRYYKASLIEIGDLNEGKAPGISAISDPSKVIFGHTHQPSSLNEPELPDLKIPGKPAVKLFNTGGWLYRQQKGKPREFCGAEIFTYETGAGFSSHRVA